MITKKSFLLVVLLIATGACFSTEKLIMFIDVNRFLDKDRNTILNIDYQIPYRNLIFLSQKSAFFAELDITVSVSNSDSLIYERSVQDNIGVRNKYDATQSGKSYLNRISLLLGSERYKIEFKATDINSQKVFTWPLDIDPLQSNSLISDIELCSSVVPDTTTFMSKFKRGNLLYNTEPSLIFSKDLHEDIYVYYELYPPSLDQKDKLTIVLMLERGEDIILDQLFEVSPKYEFETRSFKLPLKDLDPGMYYGSISVYHNEKVESRLFEFLVTEKTEQMYFIFADPDEEYNLMKYFLASRLPSDWQSMNREAKRRYISQFWQVLGTSAGMSPQAMVDTINDRVQYANRYFSHFSPGWTTDMGRIYIRKGQPEEIEKDETGDDTRFVRKDYQIWRYPRQGSAVYVFVDIQMSGNFKLIYVVNDDMEFSHPDWQRYLGTDFDTTKLRY